MESVTPGLQGERFHPLHHSRSFMYVQADICLFVPLELVPVFFDDSIMVLNHLVEH